MAQDRVPRQTPKVKVEQRAQKGSDCRIEEPFSCSENVTRCDLRRFPRDYENHDLKGLSQHTPERGGNTARPEIGQQRSLARNYRIPMPDYRSCCQSSEDEHEAESKP